MKITRKGKIRLLRGDGLLVSQHVEYKEALESADNQPNGTYTIKHPDEEVVIDHAAPSEPDPPSGPDPDPQPEPDPNPEPIALTPLAADPIVGTVTKPARGGTFSDPVYGLPIRRMTDGKERQNYSRRQAWNCDGTRYLAYWVDNGSWVLHDDATTASLRTLSGMGGDNCEPLWSATEPSILIYNNGLRWFRKNVETNADEVLFDFAGKLPWPKATQIWTKGEGCTSADGKILFLMATNYNASTQQVEMYGMVCFDVAARKIIATRDETRMPDHCSTSPSGRWGVYSGSQTVAWNQDFSESRVLFDGSQHSDLAIGPEGDDYIAWAEFKGANDGYLMMHNIDAGKTARLYDTYDHDNGGYTAYHISGKGYDRPGYIVVSAYGDASNYGQKVPSAVLCPLYRKVSLFELKEGGAKLNVCHIRTTGTGYYDEPQATASRDLSRIMFASNLGDGPSNAYEVRLP